jgi:hypothetical protein
MGDIFPWLGRCWCHKHRSREERLERDSSDLSDINVQEGLDKEEKEGIKEVLADSEMERSPNLRNAIILID